MRVALIPSQKPEAIRRMDKKSILAIGLCIAVLIVWQMLFQGPNKPRSNVQDGGTLDGVEAKTGSPTSQGEKVAAQTKEESPPVERGEEKLATLQNELFEAVFSSRGASLKSFKLHKFKERSENKKRTELKEQNLVSGAGERGQPFSIRFREEGTSFQWPSYTDWEITEQSANQVQFRYVDSTMSTDKPVILKTFKSYPGSYLIDLVVEIQNVGSGSIKEQIVLDVVAAYHVAPVSGCMGCGGVPTVPRLPTCFANGKLLSVEATPGSAKDAEPQVRWTGINEQYFLLSAITLGEEKSVCKLEARRDQLLLASLMYPEANISPGGSAQHKFRLFNGPKKLSILEEIQGGAGEGKENAALNRAVDFGWLDFLCYPMIWLLKTCYGWVGNYGISIIILTLIVKLLMIPLTQKSMKSARDMAKLRPLMEDLKKKFGEDRQRLNQETMNLYKAHKINPLGGCLPMILQMPIWIALYRTLYSSVELYQTPFISGWIDDLSDKDPLYILPLVMGVAMFLQQKMSPTSVDSQQAKMMLYMMPILFTFMMLFLPSGLVLYIFVSSLLSVGHQLWYNRNTSQPGEEISRK
jgi:YidC/Oxa1 family membrane protein insertase